jgi:L-asparaginase
MNSSPPFEQDSLPRVIVLATGGTIAGHSASSTDTTDYAPGQVSGAALIDAVPEIASQARVTVEQFANIASPDMTQAMLLALARMVKAHLAEPDIAGVVVTHGTSTCEETAMFLALTIDSEKPVVLVGAMRPGTALSADGPLHLVQAVALAASASARGRGVLMVANDRIGCAAYTSKQHTQAVDAFRAPDQGYLGVFVGATPRFFYSPARVSGLPFFDVEAVSALPRVDIFYSHQDEDPGMLDAAVERGAKGIVVAGTGNSTISLILEEKIAELEARGITVVRASHVGSGFVSAKTIGIAAGFHVPQKARILLCLCLQAGLSMAQIADRFIAPESP